MVLVLSSAYLLVGVLGLILIDTSVNILAINQADNVLHLAGGALGIGVVAPPPHGGPSRRKPDSLPGTSGNGGTGGNPIPSRSNP